MKTIIRKIGAFFARRWKRSEALVTALFVLAPFGFLVFRDSLRAADASSIQAGLTLTTEIFGVIIGAILVIIGLLIEQDRQAQTVMSSAFLRNRQRLQDNVKLVLKARSEFIAAMPKSSPVA